MSIQAAAQRPVAHRPLSAVKGLIAMVGSMALFITNDTFMKLALREVPLSEGLGLRTVMVSFLFLGLIVASGDILALRYAFRRSVLVRSSLDTVTTFLYVAALAAMPIASTTTIYMATPLITTALAVPLLGEKVGWRSWSAIIVGFCGAVIVTRPDPATFSLIALLPLMAAFTGAARDISTRSIGPEIPGSVVGLTGSVVFCLAAALLAPFERWTMPSTTVVAYLIASAVAFGGGTLLLVFAFRSAPIASLSPMRYLLVFGALISGYFVFGDLPDAWTSIGMALVVGAGLYAIQREHAKSRAARRAAREAPKAGAVTLAAGSLSPGSLAKGTCQPAAACAPARD